MLQNFSFKKLASLQTSVETIQLQSQRPCLDRQRLLILAPVQIAIVYIMVTMEFLL